MTSSFLKKPFFIFCFLIYTIVAFNSMVAFPMEEEGEKSLEEGAYADGKIGSADENNGTCAITSQNEDRPYQQGAIAPRNTSMALVSRSFHLDDGESFCSHSGDALLGAIGAEMTDSGDEEVNQKNAQLSDSRIEEATSLSNIITPMLEELQILNEEESTAWKEYQRLLKDVKEIYRGRRFKHTQDTYHLWKQKALLRLATIEIMNQKTPHLRIGEQELSDYYLQLRDCFLKEQNARFQMEADIHRETSKEVFFASTAQKSTIEKEAAAAKVAPMTNRLERSPELLKGWWSKSLFPQKRAAQTTSDEFSSRDRGRSTIFSKENRGKIASDTGELNVANLTFFEELVSSIELFSRDCYQSEKELQESSKKVEELIGDPNVIKQVYKTIEVFQKNRPELMGNDFFALGTEKREGGLSVSTQEELDILPLWESAQSREIFEKVSPAWQLVLTLRENTIETRRSGLPDKDQLEYLQSNQDIRTMFISAGVLRDQIKKIQEIEASLLSQIMLLLELKPQLEKLIVEERQINFLEAKVAPAQISDTEYQRLLNNRQATRDEVQRLLAQVNYKALVDRHCRKDALKRGLTLPMQDSYKEVKEPQTSSHW